MISPTELPHVAPGGATNDTAEGAGAGSQTPVPAPAVITRGEAIAQLQEMMVAEGTKPKTAELIASIYMTTSELDKMFAALDEAGGLPGLAGLVGGMFRRRRRDA